MMPDDAQRYNSTTFLYTNAASVYGLPDRVSDLVVIGTVISSVPVCRWVRLHRNWYRCACLSSKAIGAVRRPISPDA